ncbi:hypothetical protein ASG80_11875 [Agromyces sp. Soil535]|nr:hypothetical protein ASG80_11875 [Agromyces sp. Soil535]
MDQRMTRPARMTQSHPARAGLLPKRLDRAVSWSDFRTAVRYDPDYRLLLAVPAISAKRAEHTWLGEAVSLHTRVGDADVYRRVYEHGSVYWSERTGAHEVHGEIAARWLEAGGEASYLGLPTGDEQRLVGASRRTAMGRADGGFAHFEGASIYWTTRHGAAIVHGMVRDIWALLGWERSPLGVPVADVVVDATGVMSGCFEHGTITWSPSGGPEIVVTAPAASAAFGEATLSLTS